MNKEIINQLKTTKTIDEFKKLATENGYTLNDEEANHYFDLFHSEGKITDEELNSVAGGGCGDWCRGASRYSSDGKHELIVTAGNTCASYKKPLIPGLGLGKTCGNCNNMYHDTKKSLVALYCKIRTFDNDPYNSAK